MPITPMLASPEGKRDSRTHDGPGRRTDRAAMIMAALTELVPWDGYALCAWDMASGTYRHTTLASQGYSSTVLKHMNDGFIARDPAFEVLHTRSDRGLCWRDLQRDWGISIARSYTGEEILMPAGFREGMTRCLRTPDGRYTGAIHISWSADLAPAGEVFATVESFRTLLADACDLLRATASDALTFGGSDKALIITLGGALVDVPGVNAASLMQHPPSFNLMRRHLPAARLQRFMWADPQGIPHRVELIPLEGGATLLKETPTSWPFGLTRREAQVLHLVAAGASNPQIGDLLFVSPRTVATHVESILRKLACSSRSQLAAVAVAAGVRLLDDALTRS